jgi:hypothetical protein
MKDMFLAINREIKHRSVRLFIEKDVLKLEIGLWGDIPELAEEFGPEEAYGWISAKNYILSLKHRTLSECLNKMYQRGILSATEVATIESTIVEKILISVAS